MVRRISSDALYKGRKGEEIGGGWFVFRRGKKTGRIGVGTTLPFEHPDYEAALTEADRLRKKYPDETFVVLGEVVEEQE